MPQGSVLGPGQFSLLEWGHLLKRDHLHNKEKVQIPSEALNFNAFSVGFANDFAFVTEGIS